MLCLLTLACGFARTGNQLFILNALVALLVAILLATAQRLAYSCVSFGIIKKDTLIYTGLALFLGCLCAWPFGFGLTLMLSWKECFFIVTAVNVALSTFSVIFLPPEKEWDILLEPFRMWEQGFIAYWIKVLLVICCLGWLCYILG